MSPRVPEAGSETLGNGVLNKQETPSWSEGSQFTLGRSDQRCKEGASRICVLAKESAARNGYTLGTVAALAGTETPYVSKCFDEDEPHKVLRMLAAVLLLDGDAHALGGVAQMTGRAVTERPRLTPEEKVARLESYLRRRGKVGEMEIVEAYGEDAP